MAWSDGHRPHRRCGHRRSDWFLYLLPLLPLLSILQATPSGHRLGGIQCDWQKSHNNLLSELGLDNPRECPRAFDPSDKIFCCSKDGGNSIYCCGASEFGKAGWIGSLGIVIIAAGAVFMMLVCCMCCICCPCCPLYKRRHRGTVYGTGVQTTIVTVPHPAPAMAQQQPPPTGYPHAPPTGYPHAPPGYPQPPAGYSQPSAGPYSAQQPPSYNEVTTSTIYTKQAPYNPNYN